jgi:hypothetical protein
MDCTVTCPFLRVLQNKVALMEDSRKFMDILSFVLKSCQLKQKTRDVRTLWKSLIFSLSNSSLGESEKMMRLSFNLTQNV